MSANEILGLQPSLVPKRPASPLMAFLYRPHKSPSVPAGGHSSLLPPIHAPRSGSLIG